MMTCKELADAIAADETPGWRRWLAMRLHLRRCPPCQEYADQIRALGDCAREAARESPEDAAALERLEEAILGKIERGER